MSHKKILPVFIPFAGCKHRCVYCNQYKITGALGGNIAESAASQIYQYLSFSSSWDELAFYGGSFSCLPERDRLALYKTAKENGFKVLRFSTTPDCITDEILLEAKQHGVKTIELGIQSLSERVLRLNKRPYSFEECVEAVKKVRRGFNSGVQIMTGMYGETVEDLILTVEKLSSLSPDYARIYPTVVLSDTELEELFEQGQYTPPSAVDILLRSAYAYAGFMAGGVNVIRVGLQYTDDIEVSIKGGFYHPAFGDLVKTLIIMIYLNCNEEIFVKPENVHSFYGYKALVRTHFPDKIITDESFQTDLRDICLKAKENIFEDNCGSFKGDAASFAEKLVSQTNNRQS